MSTMGPRIPEYDYVNRTYGTQFARGQAVTLDEYGGIEGRVLPSKGTQYVDVEFTRNGKRCRGPFHPQSITVKP